jgi:hypothetical protein
MSVTNSPVGMTDVTRARSLGFAGMAGWLFADLALVLAFVFLDSTAQGQAGGASATSSTTTTTTTTTTAPVITAPNGLRPEPIKITVRAELSGEALIKEIETRLSPELTLQELPLNQKFLLVFISGGAKGLDDSEQKSYGMAVADSVRGKIEGIWDRIGLNAYFKQISDGGVEVGYVMLELFPVIE